MSPAVLALGLFDLALLLFLVAGIPGYRGHPRVLAVTTACLLTAAALAHLEPVLPWPWFAAWAPALGAACWVVYGLAFCAAAFGDARRGATACPADDDDQTRPP